MKKQQVQTRIRAALHTGKKAGKNKDRKQHQKKGGRHYQNKILSDKTAN